MVDLAWCLTCHLFIRISSSTSSLRLTWFEFVGHLIIIFFKVFILSENSTSTDVLNLQISLPHGSCGPSVFLTFNHAPELCRHLVIATALSIIMAVILMHCRLNFHGWLFFLRLWRIPLLLAHRRGLLLLELSWGTLPFIVISHHLSIDWGLWKIVENGSLGVGV